MNVNNFSNFPGWTLARDSDRRVRDLLSGTDWTREALALTRPDHVELAARGVALGGVASRCWR